MSWVPCRKKIATEGNEQLPAVRRLTLARALLYATPVAIAYGALAFVFNFLGAAFDQPHPKYVEGTWLTYSLPESFWAAAVYGGLMAVIVPVDLYCQSGRDPTAPFDFAYYPRMRNCLRAVSHPIGGLLLLFGFLLLLVYYLRTIIDVWNAERVAGLVWPPERVWFTCQISWSLLWVADCLTRKNYGTLVAASGFLGMTFLILQGVAMTGPLRE